MGISILLLPAAVYAVACAILWGKPGNAARYCSEYNAKPAPHVDGRWLDQTDERRIAVRRWQTISGACDGIAGSGADRAA
jgi:hypothetical protein